MTAIVAQERAFTVFPRGDIRDQILQVFRNGLRKLINPRTGQLFTEDDIQAATAVQSRFWIEATAIDLAMMATQRRALFLADQVRPDRAGSGFLRAYHADLWGLTFLLATGGSGTVVVPEGGLSNPATFIGSTTIGDPVASTFVSDNGTILQVLFTTTLPIIGGTLDVKAVNTGPSTNLPAGTELQPSNNLPTNYVGLAEVQSQMTGGAADETDAEFADRLLQRIRDRPAAGNPAHFRAWAREASTAVEDAFVYACALQAGSVAVAITQKRGGVAGPDARIPSVGLLTTVRGYLTPPLSPVVPTPPYVLVVAPQSESTDMQLSLSMRRGVSSGWLDEVPWPAFKSTTTPSITGVTSQTQFEITLDIAADVPVDSTPSLMVWNDAASSFELLDVQSVTSAGGGLFDVVLNTSPAKTLASGDWISPGNGRLSSINQAITAYFDSLGPGEVVASTDTNFHRAFRQPEPFEEYPQNAGSGITPYLFDALGALIASVTLRDITINAPTLADPAAGPNLLTAGKVAVYSE